MTGHSRRVSGAGRRPRKGSIGPAKIGPHRWTCRVGHADEVEDLNRPPVPEHVPLLVAEPRRVEFHMDSDKPGLIMRERLLSLLRQHGEEEVHG